MDGLISLLLFAAFFCLMMRFGCGAHMVHGHGGQGRGAHAAHGRGAPADATGSSRDPVCGMEVAPGSGYTKTHEGHEYRLCSRACLDRFETTPRQYAA